MLVTSPTDTYKTTLCNFIGKPNLHYTYKLYHVDLINSEYFKVFYNKLSLIYGFCCRNYGYKNVIRIKQSNHRMTDVSHDQS